jgi:hypothetical protein
MEKHIANCYIINGIRYVPETTEPVKRERKQYLIKDNGDVLAIWQGNKFLYGGHAYFVGDTYNASELFDGDIVISKDDFDRADRKCFIDQPHTGQMSANYVERLKRELFK